MGNKKKKETKLLTWIEKYNSIPGVKEELLNCIKETGIPLEIQATTTIAKAGFDAHQGHYIEINEQKKEITKEIDIIAHGPSDSLDIQQEDLQVITHTTIIAKCESMINQANLIYPSLENIGNITVRLPIQINTKQATTLFAHGYTTHSKFEKIFKEKARISGSICIIKPEEINSQEFLAGNKPISEAAEQVLCAAQHQIKNREMIYFQEFENFLRDENYKYKLRGHFTAPIIIPLIITDAKIFEVKLNEKHEPNELEEIPFYIYRHGAKNPERYPDVILPHWTQEVIVCNIEHLELTLTQIKLLEKKFREELTESIINRPDRIKEWMKSYSDEYKNKKMIPLESEEKRRTT